MIILNIRTIYFLDLPIQKGRKYRKQRRKKNEKNTNHVALNDSNCKCKFKFGVSEHFSSAIDSHRSDIQVNQSSAKVNQTLFQDLLSEFPDTDTNDFQVENSIIHQLQNGFESNYNDVTICYQTNRENGKCAKEYERRRCRKQSLFGP